jgi:hypothetical protein
VRTSIASSTRRCCPGWLTYEQARDVGVYVTGEVIRVLDDLVAKECEGCADPATKAVAAPLMQEQTDLVKAQGTCW